MAQATAESHSAGEARMEGSSGTARGEGLEVGTLIRGAVRVNSEFRGTVAVLLWRLFP